MMQRKQGNNNYKPTINMAVDYKPSAMQTKKRSKRWARWLLLTLVFAIVLAIGFTFVTFRDGYWPAKIENVKIHQRHYTTGIVGNKNMLSVMSYNVKSMESSEKDFIYTGENSDDWTSTDTVVTTINNMAKLIEDNNPDIILLQEVDIASKRTQNINEVEALLDKISDEYQYWACAPYLKTRTRTGHVDMQLCTISKYPITQATRYALPNTDNNNLLTRQFQEKRAILGTTIKINGKDYQIYNLHLSRYAQHTSATNPQLTILEDLMANHSDNRFIVGGDFNMLPDKKFLQYVSQAQQMFYTQEDQHFKQFFQRYQSIPTLQDLNGANFKNYFTFLDDDGNGYTPDRTIDYFFIPQSMKLLSYKVVNNDLSLVLSDHIPIIVTVAL